MSAYWRAMLIMPRSASVYVLLGSNPVLESRVNVFEYLKPLLIVLICSAAPWSNEITFATSGNSPVELRIEAMSPRLGDPGLIGTPPALGGPASLGNWIP